MIFPLNPPFLVDFPIEPSIHSGFSMAILNNQRVSLKCPNHHFIQADAASSAMKSRSAASYLSSSGQLCQNCWTRHQWREWTSHWYLMMIWLKWYGWGYIIPHIFIYIYIYFQYSELPMTLYHINSYHIKHGLWWEQQLSNSQFWGDAKVAWLAIQLLKGRSHPCARGGSVAFRAASADLSVGVSACDLRTVKNEGLRHLQRQSLLPHVHIETIIISLKFPKSWDIKNPTWDQKVEAVEGFFLGILPIFGTPAIYTEIILVRTFPASQIDLWGLRRHLHSRLRWLRCLNYGFHYIKP